MDLVLADMQQLAAEQPLPLSDILQLELHQLLVCLTKLLVNHSMGSQTGVAKLLQR